MAALDDTHLPHPDIANWRLHIRHWFPKLQEMTYFVPPVFMNRVHYQPAQIDSNPVDITGEGVHITHPPVSDLPGGSPWALQDSHVREDKTQQRILCCVKKLTDKQPQPMVVISQLNYGEYLGKSSYAAAAKMLPRPGDLLEKCEGDFDLLLLHKDHGVVVAEIKIVGDNWDSLNKSKEEQDDLLVKKVKLGIEQLTKAGEVLVHLVHDLKPAPPRVRKTLMLPNVTRQHLQSVLHDNPMLSEELCQCLDLPTTADPADFCACSDEFDVKANDSENPVLGAWWERFTSSEGSEASLTDDTYEDLVARFAGPATTVTVFWVSKPRQHFRSEGEGVHETAVRFARFILRPEQVADLNSNKPLVYLCGPPGTGKTLVLVVRARDWWLRGWNVHVLNTHDGSLAASHLIAHQLRESAEPKGERVHLHVFNFKMERQVEAAVKCLAGHATGQEPLCVIADETYGGPEFEQFCTDLNRRVPNLYLWAASHYHAKRPKCLSEFRMTEPLRTPPTVTELVAQSESILHKRVYEYTQGPTPPPAEGSRPRIVKHQGEGHCLGSPVECETCGEEVAQALIDLHVNVASTDASIPAPLSYRDVFMLTAWDEDDLHDEDGGASHRLSIKPASGVVKGLRKRQIPVRVVKYGDAEAVREVATFEGPDEVVAAWVGTVNGLERAVVVWIQTHKTGSETVDEDLGRLSAISRTTGKLVWVVWPFEEYTGDD